MKIYKKAILPLSFKASGMVCGIKRSGKPDLALFYSLVPAKASCLFTSNRIQAAHIKLDKIHLKKNRDFRAIIANSGNANCFTGQNGIQDVLKITQALASALGLKKEAVLVASTGVIGKRLPRLKIKQALPKLVKELSSTGIDRAKKAIMTTDTFVKEITVKQNIGNHPVTICGIAKGAGMIAPDMATMLVFILTDANISQSALQKALKIAGNNSFNCITVDGCMSTNDTVISLANGAAGNNTIDLKKNFHLFLKALRLVCLELAKMIVKDAEGATKFIQIKVRQARSLREAKRAALAIANSNLFKTAMYGENPNFGRIVASVGASGIDVKEKDLKVKLSLLSKGKIYVDVSLERGNYSALVYTSDLTPDYIKINAEYN